MTRTISFITATVGAALLFAVPAWGDNWGADQRRAESGYLNPDSADRAAALAQSKVAAMLDGRERALGAKHEATLGSDFYADGFAQAVKPRDSGPTPVPSPFTVTSTGTEIEWPQIAIGFGLGIVLALGLYLAMRFTRIRPLAH